ncbi:hypothetical protein MKW92_017359 [Papaver armeniacum]|nr:hypothetical protein MKW92_017359 [Papaver armeniacum]
MAQIHRQYAQDEIKNCSADNFYGFLKNEMTKLPQILPHIFKRSSHEETVKDKIEAMDDESRTLTVSVIDGALLRMYTKFEYTVTVTPLVTQGAEQSCIVKMFVEYEKKNEDVPDHPKEYMEMAASINKAIASHLANKA